MEAIPRLPMLSFETKPFYPKNAIFGPDLLSLIRQHYQEDPNNYLEEIQQLEILRQQAAKLNKDMESVAVLKKYLCQLCFLQKRFPSLKDGPSNNELSWKDLISSSNSKKVDYRSEFATTLYNIGVLHTQLGAADDRTTEEGLKMACTHFQCAAWAFQYLREVTSVNARPDFDHGYLEFVIYTCLAQAQECIAEKSISDNRKPCTSAKIVTQICEYYQTAKHGLARLVQEDSIFVDSGVKCPQVNLTYLKYKLPYYRSIANLFLGMQAEEDEKMGERVAYFEVAADEFNKARQHAAEITEYPLNKGLDEAVSFIHDIVEGKLKNAVSENNFIYHEEVPPKDKLQRVKGASLVKCIGFDFNDVETSGPDIFSKLISMKAHVLSSVYSEEKAKLLRNTSASVEEKESELNSFMQSFKLDYLNRNEDSNTLPEELIERCAACEAKPNLAQDLISSMNKLADAHHEVAFMMKEIMTLIEEEEKADEEFQIIMGTHRPPSIVSTDLKCEANRYQEALKKATESNESLRDAIAAHVNNIRVLSSPPEELEKQLPIVSLEYSPEEYAIVTELQRLVNKVEEMKNQRALLMLRLRESLRNDDITDQIGLNDEDKNNFSNMVAKEIAKHQEIVNLIEQNLRAQGNILKAITNAYAAYAPIRKIISETAHKRSIQIKTLIESFDVSDDVLQKTAKGLDFYRRLEVNARKLLSRVKGTCKVQEEERLQMYAKTGKTAPSRYRPPPQSGIAGAEKAVATPASATTTPAVPKLKDYIARGRTGKTGEDASLPYNPYYSATPASASVLPPYGPSVPRLPPDPSTSAKTYYSTVARPPPLGSENKVATPAKVEPPADTKGPLTAAAPAVIGYAGYNYAYYSQPVAPAVGATPYLAPVTASSVLAPNVQSYSAVNTFSTPSYSAGHSYSPATSSSNMHGYACAYNRPTASTNANANAPYSAHNSIAQNNTFTTKAVDVASSSQLYAASTAAAHSSTVSGYSYPIAATATNAYPPGYQVSNHAVGNNYSSASICAAPTAFSSATSSTIAYTTLPGAAAVITTSAQATSYANSPAADRQYLEADPTPSSALPMASYNCTAEYPTVTNPLQNPPTGEYGSHSYGITNYSNAPIADRFTAAKQSYNAYQMMVGYGSHNSASYYSYLNDPRYISYSNFQQQRQHHHHQQAHMHLYQLQPSNLQDSTNLTNFASSTGTNSLSYYTNAGPNATPSTVDGRNYLIAQQHSALSDTPIADDLGEGGTVEGASESNNMYYTSPYGLQQFHPLNTADRSAEQFVSRHTATGREGTNEAADRLQPKRNSMTYMQAGSFKDGGTGTTFTFSTNSSSSSASSSKHNNKDDANKATTAIRKEPSNVDLLGDFDFSVTDVPLMPSASAPAAINSSNKIAETLSNLNLDNGNSVEPTKTIVFEKTLDTILPPTQSSQEKQSRKPTVSRDFTDELRIESLASNVPFLEANKSLATELFKRLSGKEEVSKPSNERLSSSEEKIEAINDKPVDPLSSIDALWPLKKEQC